MDSGVAPNPVSRHNWFQRNWKWFVPVGCGGMVAVMAGFVAVIFMIIMGSIKSSDAFKMAMAAAAQDPQVQQRLGTPIEAGWFISGKLEVTGSTGTANLSIPIHGPLGKGKLYADGTKTAGQWRFSTLVVEVEKDGSRIDLLGKQ